MNDQDIKKWMGEFLEQKDFIYELLAYLNGNDLKQGILRLPEELFNKALYPVVLRHSMPFVTRYTVSFSQKMIFLELDLYVKQFGPLQGFYMLQIDDFSFSPQAGHHMNITFREDIKSTGNAMQAMMFRTAKSLLSCSFLEKALHMAEISGVQVKGSSLVIHWDALPLPDMAKKIAPCLTLQEMQAEEQQLTCRFFFH